MNKSAIRKLRRKFALIAFVSFMGIMLVMGTMIYLFNLYTTNKQIRAVLNYIVENDGDISKKDPEEQEREEEKSQNEFDRFLTDVFGTGVSDSPELRYRTRYFSVKFTMEKNILWKNTNNVAAITTEEAEDYAFQALLAGQTYGTYDRYTYQIEEFDNGALVVFVDCEQQHAVSKRLLNIILGFVAVGAVAMFILVTLLSKRMIQPEIRNAERQKQFITNAGHELKTPLAVIRANTELEMMLSGENEWNQSTLRQTEQMTKLIQDLIMIARADETGETESYTDVDISAAVREAADSLSPLAQQADKTMKLDIADGIILRSQEGHIRQLAALLIDNAIKYCDDNGTIVTELSAKGKNIRLVVANDYKKGAGVDYNRFFERFYRAEESHGGEKSGYGIGLSIAESIVKRYRGSINASWSSGMIRFTCILRSE